MTAATQATCAYVGIGANLGDACAQVLQAIDALAALPLTTLRRRSSLYRSAPVDAAGPDFVNAVVELGTGLSALALLHEMQSIEQRQGRVRSVRHAPRTIDLDLLLYGAQQSDSSELTLPHPRLHRRAFVLRPLLEIAPLAAAPGLGLLAPWLDATGGQAVERLEVCGPPA